MFAGAAAGLATAPFTAMVRASFTGVPYKVYAVEAPGRVSAPFFLAATVPARALRFLAVALLTAGAAALLRRYTILGHRGLLGLFAAGWTGFYAWYWLTI